MGKGLRIDIKPMGAVRMTNRGKWVSESAKRYLDYKQQIAWQLKQYWHEPTDAVCGVEIIFYMPIPKSWSKKKQREHDGQVHNKKPDIDNLIKGVFDAANGIIWRDDNQVAHITARKRYSFDVGIEIQVQELF